MNFENFSQYLVEAKPTQDGAVTLHHQFRKKIKKSFILLVEEVARSLKKDYQEQLDFLNHINVDRRCSVHVYNAYYTLLGYVATNDIKACEQLCGSLLTDLNNDNIYKEHFTVETVKGEAWENDFLKDISSHEGSFFEALSSEDLEKHTRSIKQVIEMIHACDAGMGAEFDDHVNEVFLPRGRLRNYLGSGSGVKYFGVLFITAPHDGYDPLLYFFDLMVHEASHFHLNIIMAFDPIVLNDPSERFHSPARNNLRPMKGIFHAHFVFYRVVLMYLEAAKYFNPNNEPLPTNIPVDALEAGIGDQPWEYQRRLAAWIYKFKKGEVIIGEHAKFTETGRQLFDNMSAHMVEVLKEAGLE